MAYSFDQALIQLQTTERTPQALLNLVKQVSIEASGSTTIFYGGMMPNGSTHTTQVITAMVQAGDDRRRRLRPRRTASHRVSAQPDSAGGE